MNKTNSDKYTVISVESRKGGVGKTTAALNLAALLLKENYSVLLIDMDITGTNISVANKSPFWRNIVNAIKYNHQKNESDYANVLSLFNDEFMVGDAMLDWTNDSKQNYFIDESKINLLGSQIYSDSESKYICKPSILFDELHVHWLIEFLKELCLSFSEKTIKKSVVILDNSPGFVGIAPAIHDWLTDIGPIRGKFLTVSSLDIQDLTSCMYSVNELHTLFANKVKAAIKYNEVIKDKSIQDKFELDDSIKDFFMKLASGNIDNETKDFYCTSIKNVSTYIDNPTKYHAFVINKVPKEIIRGIFSYEFNRIWNRLNDSSVIEKLLIGRDKTSLRDHFIDYDEYIEYQFLEPILPKKERRYSRDKMGLEVIDIFLRNSLNELSKTGDLSDVIHKPNIIDYRRISKILNRYQSVVQEIIGRLDSYDKYNIAKIIDSEWLPEYPIRTVKTLLNEVLFSMDFPYEKYERFDEVTDESYDMFMDKFSHFFEKRSFNHSHKVDEQILNSLYVVIALSIRPTQDNPHYLESVGEIFSLISHIQQDRWLKFQKTNENKQESVPMFLAHEKISIEEFRNIEEKEQFWKFAHRMRINPESRESFFADLYTVCCNAQARIIDLNNDIKFMITILRDMIHKENNEEILFPTIREMMRKVIVKKDVSHNESEFVLKKEIATASYMDNFQSVLKMAVKDWELK